jgi:transcription antitermination factor NusG
MPWLVAMTQSHREIVAKRFVEKQGRIAYFPVYHEFYTDRILPLFPRYLFVHTTDGIWRFLANTVGILKVLIRNEKADIMSDEIMNNLRRNERNGVIRLNGYYNDGDRVEIVSNHLFIGWKGIFLGMKSQDRCRVLLTMLGQHVPVDIDLANIRATAA